MITGLLDRHAAGDWGELDAEDKTANDEAIGRQHNEGKDRKGPAPGRTPVAQRGSGSQAAFSSASSR